MVGLHAPVEDAAGHERLAELGDPRGELLGPERVGGLACVCDGGVCGEAEEGKKGQGRSSSGWSF